jgi:hypothetical protein
MITTNFRALAFLSFSIVTFTGCAVDSGGGGPATDDPAPAQTEPEAAKSPATPIAFHVKVIDARSQEILPGVEVCAADRPEIACATSGSDGMLDMQLPPDSELMLRCQSATHGPAYMTWTIGRLDIDAGTFSLLEKSAAETFIALSGGTQSATQGAITVNVYEDLVKRDKRVAGASFTITPNTGAGPTYVGKSKLPDRSLTSSTDVGPGLFYDLAPGDVTITISHPTRKCTGGFGWKTNDATALRSRIFGGGLSNVTFVCPP